MLQGGDDRSITCGAQEPRGATQRDRGSVPHPAEARRGVGLGLARSARREAVHSALDFGAAAVTWLAVRTSGKPPDAEHHYGHGKIENLAALLETALLVVTSIWIVREALDRLSGDGHEVRWVGAAAFVMAVSIVVDVFRARDLGRAAAETGSQALEADALHFRSDIASSCVVLLGLACAWAAGRGAPPLLAAADPAAAIAVAALVLVLSWRLGRRAVDVLLDRAPTGVARAIETSGCDAPRGRGLPARARPPSRRHALRGRRAHRELRRAGGARGPHRRRRAPSSSAPSPGRAPAWSSSSSRPATREASVWQRVGAAIDAEGRAGARRHAARRRGDLARRPPSPSCRGA